VCTQANKKVVEDLATTLARHAKEREDLADVCQVIMDIFHFLGVLHDVKVLRGRKKRRG